MNGKRQKRPWYVLMLGAMILVIAGFSDHLKQYDLLIPAVILVFLFGFGLLLRLAVLEWKKRDDEILETYNLWHTGSPNVKPPSAMQVFSTLVFIIAFLFIQRRDSDPAPAPAYILAAVALIINLCSVILPRLKARRADTDSPARKPRITSREITVFLAGLFPCLFICFFIGIGIWNGVWWFTLPPGLIFLLLFSRPLVAAVRSVVHRHREADERLPTSRKEVEPWDRPDFDPERYRKK